MRRILLVEPAQGHLLREEVAAYRERGWEVHVNTFRHAEGDVPREGLPLFRFDPSRAEAVSAAIIVAGGFDAIKVRSSTRYGESFFREVTSGSLDRPVRVLGRTAAGLDSIDLDAAARHGVRVVHTPGANADAVAEFTLGLMLAALRQIPFHTEHLRSGGWVSRELRTPWRGMPDVTVGVVGSGAIGSRVAELCRLMGSRVVLIGRRERPALIDLLRTCDVVTLHVPLDDSTRNLIDEQVLAAMKPGSVLVNTARGGLVDEEALDQALRDPRAPVALAAVDVFRSEGPDRASPLIGNPYCLLSPHVAGMTWSAMRQAVSDLCARITETPM